MRDALGHRPIVTGSGPVMTAAVLAAVDALAGLYLITYGLTRERRDKAGVLIVGGFVMACGAALSALTFLRG
jgi:hypothetical protein